MGVQTAGGGDDPDCCLAGANALAPDLMTAAERLDEIAEILAAGILRARRKLRGDDRRDRVRLDFSPDRSMHADRSRRRKSSMTESIAARVAALPKTPTPELKQMWRELFDKEPPGFSRSYLISRLAYRIQELAYGGLKPATRAKLDALADGLDPKAARKRVVERAGGRHAADPRVARHRAKVTVLADGFEWEGRRYKSLSAVARAITGTRWNGLGLLRREAPWGRHVSPRPARKLRCAVYTRKSSEEGLEQEFNSLHAQREAGLAYIASQKSEGWIALPDHYDDGGISGGTLERPALKRLLRDVEAGLIDVVVVYKIDRLSRSLTDFAKLVDVFERHNVTFVSVTQQFNTTTSMGRLTLNILLSFAQFEREVIGERIRDKFAASRKKGHLDGRLAAARLRGREPPAGGGRARGGDSCAGSSIASPRPARRSLSHAS